MVLILLLLLSVALVFTFKPLTAKTKIPMVIFFLLFGIVFSEYGLFNLIGNDNALNLEIQPTLAYISNLAILALFLNSGMGLDLNAIKSSGKDAAFLSIVPIHVEGIIMGFIAYLLMVLVFPQLGYDIIPLYGFLIVMATYAICSPVLIIPSAMKIKASGAKSKILDNMIIASICDPFTPFPYLILMLILLVIQESGNSDISPLMAIVGLFIALALVTVIGYVIGAIIAKIVNKLITGEKLTAKKSLMLALVLNIINFIVIALTGPLAAFGIITAVGIGIGFNKIVNPAIKAAVLQKSQLLFGLLLFPIVFVYVGSQTQIDKLFNPLLLIVLLIIALLGPIIKMIVTKLYLKKRGYSKQEIGYAQTGFALKGIIIINMSVLFGPVFKSIGLEVMLDFMYLLAALSVIITIPLGILKLEKYEENWNEEEN